MDAFLRLALFGLLVVALPTTASAQLGLGALVKVRVDETLDVEIDASLPAAPLGVRVDADMALAPSLAPLPVVGRVAPDEAPLVAAPRAAPAPPPAPAAAAAAALGGAAAVETLGLARLAWLAALGLYSRIRPSRLLDNEQRSRVADLVRTRPGVGPSEVARSLGLGWGTASYHLDRLERAGLVLSERAGHHRCYFPPGALDRETRRQVGAVRGESARQVASLVLQRPGLTQSELCALLGLSASAASKQVSRLEGAHLLRRESTPRGTHVFPEPTLATALGR